jgi:hypothetical protein
MRQPIDAEPPISYATIRNTSKLSEGRSPTTNRPLLGVGWYE